MPIRRPLICVWKSAISRCRRRKGADSASAQCDFNFFLRIIHVVLSANEKMGYTVRDMYYWIPEALLLKFLAWLASQPPYDIHRRWTR